MTLYHTSRSSVTTRDVEFEPAGGSRLRRGRRRRRRRGGSRRPHRRRSGSLTWLLYTTLVTVYDSRARQIQATRQDRDERLPSFENPSSVLTSEWRVQLYAILCGQKPTTNPLVGGDSVVVVKLCQQPRKQPQILHRHQRVVQQCLVPVLKTRPSSYCNFKFIP